ncbi:SDR family NAD(P)-dependent oxidoreductase [Neisseria shayeganii]
MDSAGMDARSGGVNGAAILGFGHLGRPLAEALYQQGCAVAALKRRLTSDDICLPIALEAADLNAPEVWTQPFWAEHWAGKATWFCLLPPSAVADYADVIGRWLALAERFQVAHIVYGGSISVYGSAVRDCDENTPPQPDTESARKVLAAEQLMWASAVPNVSLLRLGGLYAAERHPLYSLLRRQPARAPHAPANMLHRDRAVAALLAAASHRPGRLIRNVVETPPSVPPRFLPPRSRQTRRGGAGI